jgi:hypothetical protein
MSLRTACWHILDVWLTFSSSETSMVVLKLSLAFLSMIDGILSYSYLKYRFFTISSSSTGCLKGVNFVKSVAFT